MTQLHGGGKFNSPDSAYKVAGGLHGVGASVVNALSEKLVAEVYREGKTYRQEYKRGLPQGEVKQVGLSNKRGTYVRWWPDPEIFPDRTHSFDMVAARLRELAFLNSGLVIKLLDKRDISENEVVTFYFEGGLAAFVRALNAGKNAIGKLFYINKEVEGTVVEIALQYQNTVFAENLLAFANNINTVDGGTHVTGFRGALTATLNRYGRKAGILKEQDANLTGEDVREGLTAVISVKVNNPQFEGQTKGKLGSSEVTGRVSIARVDAVSRRESRRCQKDFRALHAIGKGEGSGNEGKGIGTAKVIVGERSTTGKIV